MNKQKPPIVQLHKAKTGILGLDQVTDGGLPVNRPTLIVGNAGCGKTLLAMEFLIKGATEFNEPGVFVSFEETANDLIQNVGSLGFNLPVLIASKKLYIDHVIVERSEIEETGEYDLEGLFIRLNYAIDSIGAKRVVLDTIESLFSGFENTAVLRSELRRLFHWLKNKGVTAIITGERGDTNMTRQGLEEYVSDCVIMLDNRVNREVSTRRLRVLKYRGSTHGTNEYPFLIDDDGITVMPITSLMLDHEVSSKRITSGIKKLDEMLGGGYYEGSSILVTGTAGTGKTNLASFLVDAACKAGNKALYIGFEESPRQIIRNARSIGIDLAAHVNKGLLHFEAVRSSSQGLEMHLAKIYKIMQNTMPSVIVVDPITNLINSGNSQEVRGMLGRMMDMFKAQNITALYTSLTEGGSALERTEYGVSSFVDTWVLLRDYEENGERNRLIYILKSRGTAHSNRVREFTFSASGIDLINVYYDQNGVLTGSARELAKLRDKNEKLEAELQLKRKIHDLENRRMLAEAEIKTNVADVALLEEEVRILQGSNQLVTPKGSALKKGVRRG